MDRPVTGKRFLPLFVLPLMAAFLNGCIYLVVGGVGVLGGYVVSPDTFEGILNDKDQGEVWDAAIQVVSVMGIINEQSQAGGMIISKVNGAKVTVTLTPVGSAATKVTIKARKALFPKVKLAQDIYIKIVNELEK